MTRGHYYSSAMPVAAILYVIALIASHHNATVATVGAMCFALIAVCGWAFARHGPGR